MTSSMCQEPVKVRAQLSLSRYYIETETFFLSYLLSITTEKFGYSLSRKIYRDRNMRWNTPNMTASTIDGLEKKQQTAKQTKTI